MLLRPCLQALPGMIADNMGIFQQLFVFDNVEHRHRRRTGDRIAAEGVETANCEKLWTRLSSVTRNMAGIAVIKNRRRLAMLAAPTTGTIELIPSPDHLYALDAHGDTHAAADAKGRKALGDAAALHLEKQRVEDAGA